MESPKRTYQPNVCGIQAELTRRHLLGAVGSGFGALALSSLLPNSSACGDSKGFQSEEKPLPMQTIKAARKIAAETCGVGQELGTVEKGKIADLIVVKDNPLEDINNLRTLQMVFQGGHLVVDKRRDV